MKTAKHHLPLLFLLSLFLSFSACRQEPEPGTEDTVQQEEPQQQEEPTQNQGMDKPVTQLRLALAQMHRNDRIRIFSSLPSEYKYGVWKDRMEENISMADNREQKNFLTNTLGQLSAKMYRDTSTTAETRKFVENVSSEAYRLYEGDTAQVLRMFTTLSSEQTTDEEEVGGSSGGQPFCHCTTYGIDFDCHIFDECAAGNCVKVPQACGFFNIYDCNGLCVD